MVLLRVGGGKCCLERARHSFETNGPTALSNLMSCSYFPGRIVLRYGPEVHHSGHCHQRVEFSWTVTYDVVSVGWTVLVVKEMD